MKRERVELTILEECDFADGRGFGAAGAYAVVRGRARLGVNPDSVPSGAIVDLELAERDSEGLIWIATDFEILRPRDQTKSNRRLFLDYGNRGNKRCLQFFNDAPHTNRPRSLSDAGNGFLMRRGYTVVWLGWQGDLVPGDDRMLLDLPVARRDGRAITGAVRSEFVVEHPGTRVHPLSGRINTRSHPAVSLDTTSARLTKRRYPTSEPILIPSSAWAFAREEQGFGLDNQGGEMAVTPSDVHIRLEEGFEPGWIYELEYEGRDPLVLGLGHVAVRNLTSFLRYADTDDLGAANPLGEGAIEKCYAYGRSQTGRCIRDFIYHGFNADSAGRRVFDGVICHVAGAGRMNMDRFANLTYGGSTQYEDRNTDTDRFPFAYAPTRDPASGREDAILKRPDTDPLVIHTQSSTEYWQRRGSLTHTDAAGNTLPEVDGARIYLWSGSQHYSDPALPRARRGIGENFENVVQTSFLFRAHLVALDRWASLGEAPPPSRIPRREDGTLGSLDEWREAFPEIPGVIRPTAFNDMRPDSEFRALVPLTDPDGNEIAGIRPPMVEAPLGTYTGWNIRSRAHGHGALVSLAGSYVPFPECPETARMTSDPRRPIALRFASASDYAASIEAAARALVQLGFMLEEDVEQQIALANDWGRPRHVFLS
ncbi:alpha/beta hydrolase domain-containing protein [Pikeienuella sp. HZG-20]|uniref:alpha/beta hydrolase domain-containing protein n=1 Tax=Paludibacillus litoralis TaxID=3133267 RepID=UPI0030EC23D6